MEKTLWMTLIIVGISGFVLFLPLAIGGFDALIKIVISKQTRIVKGTPVWDMWRKPPVPIFMKIHIFNLTNPEELAKGAKPVLNEIGPYIYQETLEKFDIDLNETGASVKYRQVHHYYFRPDLTKGSLDDFIVFINIPFVGVAAKAHEFTDVDFMLATLDEMLSGKGEKLTKSGTVGEFIFDGFSVQAFLDLARDPMVEAAGGDFKIPEQILDGKMALLEGRNGSDTGLWVVNTGKKSASDFGRVITWNNKSMLTEWGSSTTCNAMNGTDGMIFPPFLTKDTRIEFFVPQMCRSLTFEYVKSHVVDGVNSYRFHMPQRVFDGILKNPENKCFCKEKNTSLCETNGLFTIAPCAEGAPLFISHPHFVDADSKLINDVVGLNPDPEKHVGFMDMHPETGMPVSVRHRFQFNLRVEQWPSMPTFSELSPVILPLFWLEEGADVDEGNKKLARLLDSVLVFWDRAKWVFVAFFIGVTGVGVGLMTKYNKGSRIEILNKGQRSPTQSIITHIDD